MRAYTLIEEEYHGMYPQRLCMLIRTLDAAIGPLGFIEKPIGQLFAKL